jgi:hypothetical protein
MTGMDWSYIFFFPYVELKMGLKLGISLLSGRPDYEKKKKKPSRLSSGKFVSSKDRPVKKNRVWVRGMAQVVEHLLSKC